MWYCQRMVFEDVNTSPRGSDHELFGTELFPVRTTRTPVGSGYAPIL